MKEIKKVTQPHDLSWYIKWVATLIIIVGACLNSFELQPYSHVVMCVGARVYGLFVGYLWYDRALIVVNSAILAIYFTGFVMYLTYYT